MKWDLREVEVCTDSATVVQWLKLISSAENCIRRKGSSEIIVKAQLGILQALMDVCSLKLNAVFSV